jgi:hypothetical protein
MPIVKFKIKDKLILGNISGIFSFSMVNVIDYISIRLHLNQWHIWQLSASLFFPKKELTSIPAITIGGVTHLTLACMIGVIIFFTLYYTGRTFYIIKGIGVTLLAWVMIYGGLLCLKITSITQPLGAQTNMIHMFFHILVGSLNAFMIIKLADKSVWE